MPRDSIDVIICLCHCRTVWAEIFLEISGMLSLHCYFSKCIQVMDLTSIALQGFHGILLVTSFAATWFTPYLFSLLIFVE